MKNVVLALFCMFSINLIAQEDFEMKVEEDFSLMIRSIQEATDLQVQYSKVVCGTSSQEGSYIGLVEYGLGAFGENSVELEKVKIYIGNGDKIEEIGVFEPDFCFSLISIENGIISMHKLSSCLDSEDKDAPVLKFKLVDNQFIEIE